MNKTILYIGNNLKNINSNTTTLGFLANLFKQENYVVYTSSNKNNKIIRMLDMCYSFMIYKNKIEYILIDTYSTTNFYYALLISQLSRVFKIKYIPILHGGNLSKRLKENRYFSKLIFQNSYKNVAPSYYLKNMFETHGYKTEFIPNTLEVNNYSFKLRKTIQPKLLWVRAFKNIYNPTLAIEVLKLLKKQYPKATLCMVGPFIDESYHKTLEVVKQYNLECSVEFTGILSKENWHKKSENFDIFINTTNFDNTPISVMEAMALGLPIISTNVGGMPFLINNEVDGLLVGRNNPEKMVEAIINLIQGEYQKLPLLAREKVEGFDWENVKNMWFKILK